MSTAALSREGKSGNIKEVSMCAFKFKKSIKTRVIYSQFSKSKYITTK